MTAGLRWAALALAVAAAACEPRITGPRGEIGETPVQALHLQKGGGDEQLGLPGESLPQPLAVTVLRADGLPAAGVEVRFEPAPGAGTVEMVSNTTSSHGVALGLWTLPAQLPANLSVRVRVPSEPDAAPVVFTAGRLPPDRMDVMISTVPGPVRVLVYDALHLLVSEAFRASFTDSVHIRHFEHPEARDELVAFSPGRPPLLTPASWTPAREEVRLAFREPVTVPVTFWVVKAPFEEMERVARAQADSAAVIWARSGIRLDVRIVNATGFINAGEYQHNDVDACRAELPQRIGDAPLAINVYYVGGIYDPRFDVRGQGGHCPQGFIVLAASNTRSPSLLAHELGHAFGLGHEHEGNLMDGFGRGSHVTAGQTFRVHYDRLSAIVRLGLLPASEVARTCEGHHVPVAGPLRCLPSGFDFQ